MSNLYVISDAMIRKEQQNGDERVTGLLAELDDETIVVPQTALSAVQRVLKIYRGVKPVLGLLVKLPIVPSHWSALVAAFLDALDKLDSPAVIGEITTTFKAGKDLEEAA